MSAFFLRSPSSTRLHSGVHSSPFRPQTLLLDLNFKRSPFALKASSLTITQDNANGVWTVTDHEGVVRGILQNELPIGGLRRVRNLFSAPSAPATQTVTSAPAGTYILSCRGTGSMSISGATDGSYGSLSVTNERKRLAFTVTAAQNITVTVTAAPTFFQLENSTGRTDTTTPSEEVDAVNYGLGVTGVRQFDTTNGNTVDGSGVVTEGTGTGITTGYLPTWEAAANLVAHTDNLSAWSVSLGTPSLTADSGRHVEGGQRAYKITASAQTAAGYKLIGTYAASTVHNVSAALEADDSLLTKLGFWDETGGVWLGFVDVAWTSGVPSTSSSSGATNIKYTNQVGNVWYVEFNCTTGLNTSCSVQIHADRNGTSKSVHAHSVQVSAKPYRTARIPTSGSTVTRNAMIFSYPTPSKVMSGAPFTVIWKGVAAVDYASLSTSSKDHIGISDGGAADYLIVNHSSGNFLFSLRKANVTLFNNTAAYALTVTAGMTIKIAVTFDGAAYRLYINGALRDTQATTEGLTTNFSRSYLSGRRSSTYPTHRVTDHQILRYAVSDAKAVELTT